MVIAIIIGILFLLLAIAVPVGLFFVIRYFIRYNAKQNKNKTVQQEEIEKMKITDL